MNDLKVEYKNIKELIPYCNNSRTHSDEQVLQIASSIKEFGFTNPVLIDGQGGIIAGHGRIMAAQKLKMDEVPTITLSGLSEAQKKAYIIADNKLALNSGWDDELLKIELEQLKELDFDLGLIGFSELELAELFSDEDNEDELKEAGEAVEKLSDRFMLAPFSVLNAREGWWQARKKSWIAMGLKSEVGRDENLAFAVSSQSPNVYESKNRYEEKIGRKCTMEEFLAVNPDDVKAQSGTSIFDPVLCELAYRWFSPEGGVVLDPFSGGSVRGVVAAKLGRQYVGCDLRQEQVDSNRAQWDVLAGDCMTAPVWHCGDSLLIHKHAAGTEADMIFSCPPYADLEVYSKDPNDLSNMSYPDFIKAYREIIAKSVGMLKQDSFACFVVGDVRDKKGNYYNFVGDTVQAFRDAGLEYYNEAILVTQCGSLAMRAGKTFSTSRKLGKTHQNVLVFLKGDAKKATAKCGVVSVDESLFPEEVED